MHFTRHILPTFQRPSGEAQAPAVFRYRGIGRGPSVWIQASMHASEVQGQGVIHYLMEALAALPPRRLTGEIRLVPRANPLGLDLKIGEHTPGPFSLATGANWNRGFAATACWDEDHREDDDQVAVCPFVATHESLGWDALTAAFRAALRRALIRRRNRLKRLCRLSEMQRHALAVQKQVLTADRVLDLHTSTRGAYFAYMPEGIAAPEEAAYLDMPFVLRMDEGFHGALDEAVNMPWMLLARAAARQGRKPGPTPAAMTLELGGQETLDLTAAERQARAVLNYLTRLGVIDGTAEVPRLQPIVGAAADYVPVCVPHGGLAAYVAAPGRWVAAGDVLAHILTSRGLGAPGRLIAFRSPVDGYVLAHYPSAVVHQGTCIYKVLTGIPGDSAQILKGA